MKKTLITCAIVCSAFVTAQIGSNSPWIKELEDQFTQEELNLRSSQQPFKFNEIQTAFNTYWSTRDHTVKGSGYKPFKRWENYWKDYVKEDGTLPTSQELWSAYEAKVLSYKAMSDLSDWRAIGPFSHTNTGSWSPGQGRINTIAVDPINTNTWYAGAPAGGVWKSIDAGSTWVPLADELPQIGVSGIAIDPTNSNIVYIATGDDDASDSYSVGVFKSLDGGATWNQTGLNPSNSPQETNEIYINPNDTQMLWISTSNGIYKSTNGGTTWANKKSGNFLDLKMKPGDPSTLYAATGSAFYRSTNYGETFTQVSLPGSSERLVLDVTAANPNYVYVFGNNGGNVFIYRSSNSGASFSTRAASVSGFSAGQAWYDLALGVSSTNPEDVYIGCLNVWKSSNGGSSFTKLNNWSSPNQATYTHADIHFLRSFNGDIFCGSDGGIYSSTNAGSSFTDHTEGIQIGQFYSIAVSPNTSNKVVGGLQDNGGYAYNNGNGNWGNFYGADGMDVAIDPNNDNRYYGFIQNGGTMYISTDSGASQTGGQITGPGGNWVTPLEMSTSGELYAGGSFYLHKFNGSSFTTMGALGGACDELEIDPINPNNIYAAVNNVLKISTNGGSSFTSGYNFPSNIKGMEVHNTNGNIIYVCTASKVYKSTNGGYAFTDISGGLPSGQTFYTLAHQGNHSDNPLYLGTSLGVYRMDDNTAWESFFTNLPNSPVRKLVITLADMKITAGTFGRGVWQSDIQGEIVSVDVKIVSIDNPNMTAINCGDIVPQITIKNGGQNTIDQFTINYNLNGGSNQQFIWNPSMGSIASGDTQAITLNAMTPDSGSNVINVTAVLSGDVIPGNDNKQLTFNANKQGVYSVVNQFETAITDDLVSYNENGGTSVWERGIPNDALLSVSASGANAYVTDLDGNHPDNTKSYLVSRCYDFTQITDPTLRFNMAFDIETDYDVLYMEYSLDEGATWALLGKKSSTPLWYNSDTPYGSGNADCQKCPGEQWTGEGENTHSSGGTNATIREYAYNFATNAANGETDLTTASNIMFRFVLESDASVNEEGALIDDFVIDATLGVNDLDSSEIAIYPNPTKNIVNIRLANSVNNFDVRVYDLVGKEVYRSNDFSESSNVFEVDLSSISIGVYLIQINADGRLLTKKIMKN